MTNNESQRFDAVLSNQQFDAHEAGFYLTYIECD